MIIKNEPGILPYIYNISQDKQEDNIRLSLVKVPKLPQTITKLERVDDIPKELKDELVHVCKLYAFRTNRYYLSLINWDDENDPIKRIIIPDKQELDTWGKLDASEESLYTKAPGLEHKYRDTALLLTTDLCGGYCRFCFRKRLFMDDNDEVVRNISKDLDYIKNHKELTNVILSGGDPLVLSTKRLTNIIMKIRKIDHINIIRIGSKIPAFNPFRILNDSSLIEMLKKYSLPRKRIYIMTHFNHPNELTDESVESVNMLINAGVIVANQTPVIKGVNDDPGILAGLFKELSFAGIPPYYVFQGRPAAGNRHFAVPVEKTLEIFEKARSLCSGLAKRARLVMSHKTGKIEIIGKDNDKIYFRYFRAAEMGNYKRSLTFKSNPDAYWLDDYLKAS